MMSESSKRHSKFLSLIFILKCLSKASVIRTTTELKKKHTNENRKRKNGNVLLDDDDNRNLTVVPRSPWKVTGKETYKSQFQAGRQRSLRRRGT